MMTPENSFKRSNFKPFPSTNIERSEFTPVQNLNTPEIRDKQPKYPFVVDWQINGEDDKARENEKLR